MTHDSTGADPFANVAPLDPTAIQSDDGQPTDVSGSTQTLEPAAPTEDNQPSTGTDSDTGTASEDGTATDSTSSSSEPDGTKDANRPNLDYEKSYKELQKKFGEQGSELGDIRKKVADYETKVTELTERATEAEQYKTWYEQNFGLIEKLLQDPVVAAKAHALANETRQLTPDDVRKLMQEEQAAIQQKLEHDRSLEEFSQKNWESLKNEKVQNEFLECIAQEFKDSVPSINAMDIILNGIISKHTKSQIRADLTKTEAERSKRVAAAQVGQGTKVSPATPPADPNPNLFATPPGSVPATGIFG